MLRVALVRGLAMVAFFAAVWLAPFQALAAIIPICDGDAISAWNPAVPTMRVAETNPVEDCQAAAVSPDEQDPQVAAMCDVRAATVVAPNRIHPMSDARIDAVDSCDGIQHGPLASAPGSNPLLDGFTWAYVEPAVLSDNFAILPQPFVELPCVFVDPGAPRAGFDREIYHPPRA